MAANALQGVTLVPATIGTQDVVVNKAGSEQPLKTGAVSVPRHVSAPSVPATGAASRGETAQAEERAKAAAQQLDDYMKHHGIKLSFSVDSDLKQIIVKVLNVQTGEVIRQIPSEEAVKISKAMDTLKGLIIRKSA